MMFILMLFTTLSKMLGFLREIILAYFYGVSNISDAYLISQTIPITILSFIGMGIATSYIPIYSSIVKEKSIEVADKYTNNLINFIVIMCTILIIIILLFTEPLVRLFAAGFEGNTLKLAISFTRISCIGIYFSGVTYVYNSYLNMKNNFIAPALLGIPFNFVVIISIVMSKRVSILILPIGILIAAIFQILLLIPFIRKYEYKYSFVLDLKDEYLKKMLYTSIPVIIGVSVNQINVLVDRTLASMITLGGISALSYGNRLIQFVNDVIIISLATVIYPTLSKMVVDGNINGLKKSISEAISIINLLVIPISVVFMIFSKAIISLLFARGAFNAQDVDMTSYVMFFYSIGIVGFGLREILSRAFYSLKDSKTPMINASIAMGLNIVLNIVLSKFLGIGGLALATSISAISCTILLYISLIKKIGEFDIKKIMISLIKVLGASLIMGIASKLTYKLLLYNISDNLALISSIAIGVCLYFIMIYFMKIEEAEVIINVLKSKIQKV